MTEWYTNTQSYSYSNRNGNEQSTKYSFEDSSKHNKPEERCWFNGKEINCNKIKKNNKKQIKHKSDKSLFKECPQVKCLKQCDQGYIKDKKGCKTCDCITTPTGFPEKLKLNKNNIKQIGEHCNSSLPPEYATFCDKHLKCFIENPMPGASGICIPKTTETTKNSINYKNKYLKYKKKYLNIINNN
jgi:hypothetical protein